MMKRVFAAFMAAVFNCIPITASNFAAIDEPRRFSLISIKAANKGENSPNVYINKVSGGSSSVTTANGITVAVNGEDEAFEPGVRLVVREIPAKETEAYGWFSDLLKETGTNILPFDIYFEKDGQRFPFKSKIRISITLTDNYTSPIICHVSTDGKVEVLQSTVTDSKISFETKHASYYVLADKIKDPGGFPQTGDNAICLFLIVFMMVFAGILMYTFEKRQQGLMK